MIQIFTDGGVRPTNPGPGGWAYVGVRGGLILKKGSWWEKQSTNNRMELTAAIQGLTEFLTGWVDSVEVCSDSIYLVEGASSWLEAWIARGWLTAAHKPIENVDLWRAIWGLKHSYAEANRDLRFTHVKGHSGNQWNEMVDQMATDMALFAAR